MSRTGRATNAGERPQAGNVALLRPRRSMRLLIVGIIAVCVGALASAALYLQHSATQPVLRVTRTVPRGAVVGAADLGVVRLPATPGLATVPAGQLSALIGQEALVDLPAGSLVGPSSVGRAALPPGTVQVGVKLAPGRAPVRLVPVGAAVQLIAVAGKDAKSDMDASFHAVVVTVPTQQPDGTQILDIAVDADVAARVARLAAADQIVLVREGGR